MTMTSNCHVTKSEHQIQMTTICHWITPPHENFLRTPLPLTTWRQTLVMDRHDWENVMPRKRYTKIGVNRLSSIKNHCQRDKAFGYVPPTVGILACLRFLQLYSFIRMHILVAREMPFSTFLCFMVQKNFDFVIVLDLFLYPCSKCFQVF